MTEYFVEAPLATITESSWVLSYKLGTPVFGEFLPFFSADPLKLCQVGWGASLHSYFQVSQRCSIGLKSGLWLSHSRTFRDLSRSHSCVVLAVCLGLLSCWKVSKFSSRISLYLPTFIFASILTSLPIPAAEKHHHSIMLPSPCFTVGMVPGFLQR